ncbi:MAG TPA: polysaccharide deacetylase family protein [Acidimicrobiia bacterium]|jgi:peptidoglycan/xylan/chitin deacetylase (PgdA/CDA1 family)
MARRAAWVGGAFAGAGAAALAINSAPSLIALSALGRRIAPQLAGVGRRGHVAVTFDDGPDPSSTPDFLERLAELGWRATFFMLGEMVRRAPGLAEEVAAAGHEIGVHGYEHHSQLWRSPRATVDDIARSRDLIADITGAEPEWFRPPYGTLSMNGMWAARRLQLRPVLWTAWGRDWRAAATAESVTQDVLDGFVDGGTVLLHDSDCTSAFDCWQASLAALPRIATAFGNLGLSVGPVGEHGIPATS